jgi:hypothetical protein
MFFSLVIILIFFNVESLIFFNKPFTKQFLIQSSKNKLPDNRFCKNCKYYQAPSYGFYISSLAKCTKFYDKNNITGENIYNYASKCRHNIKNCGPNGIYFEQEKNINLKKIKHYIYYFLLFPIYTVVLYFCVIILFIATILFTYLEKINTIKFL